MSYCQGCADREKELRAAVEERDALKAKIHRLIANGKGICPCGCMPSDDLARTKPGSQG